MQNISLQSKYCKPYKTNANQAEQNETAKMKDEKSKQALLHKTK